MERYEERDQSVIREAALENGPVPQPLEMRRVLERLDRLMEKRDYAAAEKHLRYWLEEARAIRDPRGELAILGETVGFYRKTGKGPEALAAVEETLALLEAGNWGDSMMAGTALVNCGTACNAFGENERALQLFGRARRIYEKLPGVPASLLGGLYNNMGLACAATGQTREALELYEAALGQMEKVPGGAAERAITCLNMADAVDTGGPRGGRAAHRGASGPGAGAAGRPGDPPGRGLRLYLRTVRAGVRALRLFPRRADARAAGGGLLCGDLSWPGCISSGKGCRCCGRSSRN